MHKVVPVFLLLFQFITNVSAQDTLTIHFKSDVFLVDSAQKLAIANWLKDIAPGKLDSIFIVGFTDTIGRVSYNDSLSQKRAGAVKAIIVPFVKNTCTINATGLGIYSTGKNERRTDGEKRIVKVVGLSKNGSRRIVELKKVLQETTKLRKNDVVPLDRVLFMDGSFQLLTAAKIELDSIADFLTKNAHLKIRIEGHICKCARHGYPADSLIEASFDGLSYKRAQAVFIYLKSKGIAKERMRCIGLGYSDPFVEEDSDENEALNRRVAFRVIEM